MFNKLIALGWAAALFAGMNAYGCESREVSAPAVQKIVEPETQRPVNAVRVERVNPREQTERRGSWRQADYD